MDRRSDDSSNAPNPLTAPNGTQSQARLRQVTWFERLAAAALALLLVVLCFFVVSPFLSAALWAGGRALHLDLGVVSATGPVWSDHWTLAALLMTLALTVAILGAFALVGFSLIEQDGSKYRESCDQNCGTQARNSFGPTGARHLRWGGIRSGRNGNHPGRYDGNRPAYRGVPGALVLAF
jgi:hypothetical protein